MAGKKTEKPGGNRKEKAYRDPLIAVPESASMDSPKKNRGRGRPAGTIKNGEKSPNQVFKILRTKSWAWTCAHYLRENEDVKPLTAYALAMASGWRTKNSGHDPNCWQRWLDGEGGTGSATTRIWPDIAPAYLIGPWVDSSNGHPNGGAFVPLWAVLACPISEADKLRMAWKKIPFSAWFDWAPMQVERGNDGIELAYENPEHLPEPKTFVSIAGLYNFLSIIAKHLESQPLLAITAAITLSKIDKVDIINFFDPFCSMPYSLSPKTRQPCLNALGELNLSFNDIINVAGFYGLKINDCGGLTYEQYRKITRRNSIRSRGFCNFDDETDALTEEGWRAIFEPSSPND